MQWIILLLALFVLLLLIRKTRRPPQGIPLDSPMDVSLTGHLTNAARHADGRGFLRFRASRTLLSNLEKPLSFLFSLPEEEWLPAARSLCADARFLQEEAAAVLNARKTIPPLPRFDGQKSRMDLFAHEILQSCALHITREDLSKGMDAWQSVLPLDENELTALPVILRKHLLEQLSALARMSESTQRSRQAALRVQGFYKHHRKRQADKLFQKHGNESAFLERLISLNTADEWLEETLSQKQLTEEALSKQEQLYQTQLAQKIDSAIQSLHLLRRLPWERLCEQWSHVHALFLADPVYEQMDPESQRAYRTRVSRISHTFDRSEIKIASAAVQLCQTSPEDPLASHIGYYLLDEGNLQLLSHLQCQNFFSRLRLFGRTHGCGLFRLFSWLSFAFFLFAGWKLHLHPLFWLPAALLFLFCAQQMLMVFVRRFLPASAQPRMLLHELGKENRTLVVCSAVLTSASQAIQLVKKLSVHHQANPDENLHFLLLGDFQDSMSGTLTTDAEVMSAASSAIRALCEETGHPFFYLQRERTYTTGEACHHGRERRRGAVQTLLKLIEGKAVQDSFAYATFDPAAFKGRYKYVITIDDNTILPPGSALRLAGAMMHPLVKRQKHRHRMRGASIIQPRIESSISSLRAPLSVCLEYVQGEHSLFYALSQQLFQRGTFTGTAILDPSSFLDAADELPEGVILSHALPEGELAGCAEASDILLYKSQPQTLNAFLGQLHRQTRGDWQLISLLLPLSAGQQLKRRTLDLTSRFKIWHILLESLVPACRLIVLGYFAATGRTWLWLCALLLVELPLLISHFSSGLKASLLRLAILPAQAFVQLDSIARALYRLFVSRRHLLSWQDGAQLQRPSYRSTMVFFAVALGGSGLFALFLLLPEASWVCSLFCALVWSGFALVHPFLEQERSGHQRPTRYMHEVLTRLAGQTYAFFESAVASSDGALPCERIQTEPDKGALPQTTPDAIAWYLCSLISAHKLGLIHAQELEKRMAASVAALEALPKWHGLPFDRYDVRSLSVVGPGFISSSVSGMLAAALLTCAQGLRTLLPELGDGALSLAQRMDDLVSSMQLARLYDPDAELFFTGIAPSSGSPAASHHHLLASEAQLLSFVAVMLRQVPISHWYRLGRAKANRHALLSQYGSMAEYIAPFLFCSPVSGTLLNASAVSALRLQSKHKHKGTFGASSSGFWGFDPDLHYLASPFGIPELALNSQSDSSVIAPYASLLAMTLNLKSGFRNLLKLQILGLQGPLGFFEAADFDPIRTDENGMQIVRMHTSGHQGMILCAICNILQEHFIARLFSSLPRVQAYSLLLEERMIHQKLWIRHPFRRPDPAISSDEESFERQARPLHFPIDAHMLSGGGTCWLIDAQGGGCILHNGQLLTRFEESCHIPSGMRIYLRDSKSGAFWVATDPYLMHSVRFEAAQAVFTHSYQQLECSLRMWVDPLDGSAVHCLELQNNTAEERIMEVCSYLEIAVDAADGDEQPAAANSSFEAERFERSGIYAVERRKSAPARRIWHLLKTDAELSMVRLQCDRAAFLGRGRSFHAPRALEYAISAVADVLGTVDDPCVSVRGQFTLAANSSVRLFLITHVAKEDEQASVFIERCSSAVNLLRSYNSAVTRAMVSAKQQQLSADEQNVLSRMTGALLYCGQPWQGGMTALSSETLSKLHIQCDCPFVLLECSGSINRSLLSLLIRGRRWFILGGFSFDLVIVLQGRRKLPALVEETEDLLHEHHAHDENGIHILKQPDTQLLSLLRTYSRLALSTTASLEDQLDSLTQNAFARPVYTARPSQQGKSTLPAADDALLFNGYGGFTPAEGHYQIMLLPGMQTPFPWQNVLQNPVMGTLTNESGLLCSFAKNEHSAFLTRHPDCAVSPRGDEAFFLQDHVNHLLWSLTRQPLGHGMPVRITHGFGETMYECSAYGIYARLQCFMDPEHPAGIRIIQIKNEDQQERTLTLSHCCIFSPAAFLKCETDRITGWDPDANGMIGLFAADPSLCTCSAMSSGMFQGLWNNAPYALSCMDRSSAKSGNTAVLSFDIHLPPGESCTFTTALCYGKNAESFEHTLHLLRDQGTSERLLLMRQLWEERLNALQFDLPDPSLTLLLNRWLPYQLWTDDDSLQNAFALLETHPSVMRKCLLSKIHANQNIDLFFLFAAASYVEISGDESILQEEEGLFLQRCIQWIDDLSFGAHDLPKIQNKESVLAGMFLCEVFRLFAPLCSEQDAKKMETRRDALLDAVERFAWNGAWYLSGWDAESAHSADEQGVDLTTQCWAVLCGVSRERCAIAMEQAWQQLYDHKTGLLQDFSNAEHMSSAAGCQAVAALHQLGHNERAWELALRLLPVSHSVSRQAALRYRCEPYAMAGGIHTGKGLRGRAFDPWDGSSASWYIVTILRMLLGFHKAGNQLSFRPVGLKAWENLRITYRFGRSTYHLHASRSQRLPMADGEPLPSGVLTLVDDGKIHEAFFPLR